MSDQYYVDAGYVDDGYYVYIADAVSAQSSTVSLSVAAAVTVSAVADFGSLFTPSITANAEVNGIPNLTSEFSITVTAVKNTATDITLSNIVNLSLSAAPIRSTSINLNSDSTQQADLLKISTTAVSLNSIINLSTDVNHQVSAISTQTAAFLQSAEVGRVSSYWINFYSNSYYISSSVQLSDDSIIAVAQSSTGRSQLIKLSSSGNILWHKLLEFSSGYPTFHQIQRLSNDSVVVGGGSSSASGSQHLIRLTSNGVVEWNLTFGSSYHFISTDSSDNIYLTKSDVTTSLRKVNSSGTTQWQKRTNLTDSGPAAADSLGNLYLAGFTGSTTQTSITRRLSASTGNETGTLTRVGGTNSASYATDVRVDGSNNVYIITEYQATSGGLQQWHLIKYDSNFNHQWSIREDSNLTTARIAGFDSVDQGIYLTNRNELLLKYTKTGNLEYVKQLTQSTWNNFDTSAPYRANLDRNRLSYLVPYTRRTSSSDSTRSGGLGFIPLNGSGTPESPFSYGDYAYWSPISGDTLTTSTGTNSLTNETISSSTGSTVIITDLTSTLVNYAFSSAGNYENTTIGLTSSFSVSADCIKNTGIIANLTTSTSLSLLGGLLQSADSALTTSALLSADVNRVQLADAAVTANFNQTAIAYRTQEFASDLSSSCSLALSGSIIAEFAIPLNSSVILAEDNIRIRNFTVSLTAFAAQLTAAVKVGVILVDLPLNTQLILSASLQTDTAVNLSAEFNQSAQANTTLSLESDFYTEFNQSIDYIRVRNSDSALQALISLVTEPVVVIDSVINLQNDSNLSLTITRIQSANAALSANFNQQAEAVKQTDSDSSLNAIANLTAIGSRTTDTQGNLDSSANISIDYKRYRNFEISQLSLFTPSITAVLSADRGSDMTVTATLSASPVKIVAAQTNLNSVFNFTADIRGIRQAEANLNSTLAQSAQGQVTRSLIANLAAISNATINSFKFVRASSSLSALAAILSTGRELQLDLYPTWRIRAESRQQTIKQETRIARIRQETRIATVRSEL